MTPFWACLQAVTKIKANFFTNVSEAIIKQIKKSQNRALFCDKARKEVTRALKKQGECSRHFLACFITEQSTVLAFLFVKWKQPKLPWSLLFFLCR